MGDVQESTFGLAGAIEEGLGGDDEDDLPPQRCKEPGRTIHVRRANRKVGYCERHKTGAENRNLEERRRLRTERRKAAAAAKAGRAQATAEQGGDPLPVTAAQSAGETSVPVEGDVSPLKE